MPRPALTAAALLVLASAAVADAEIVRETTKEMKNRFGPFSYAISAAAVNAAIVLSVSLLDPWSSQSLPLTDADKDVLFDQSCDANAPVLSAREMPVGGCD